ncbi:hypothetical protein DY000_02051372 [Brassica cretica]|uniref:Protein kinase domain-containing protein n=1 Tax=Brassica cretica TaxID=69181 RepID=A0ABQ7F435_BRACR|nr:hypothetical protein DY000_02051372 [Brassica cretica]
MSFSDKTIVDPLLKDLDEKKVSFRRNVVSLASELKQVRGRLVSQEQSFLKETQTRKEAEKKAKNMEMEMCKLHKRLEERNSQLHASASAAEKFIKDLEEFRSQLDATNQTAGASADSAESTKIQCSVLKQQLDDKTRSLREHEHRVTQLGHQLDDLQRGLSLRECSEKQLRDELRRIEREVTESITKSGIGSKDCVLKKFLEDVSPVNFERMNRLVEVNDVEFKKLKDEIRLMSGHWKHQTKELESQLEKQRRTDQDLKKKILKLEFCLQETRSQTRKLQRKEERRDMEIKEIRDLMSGKQQGNEESWGKQKFWDNSGFKIVVSMSMLMLVVKGEPNISYICSRYYRAPELIFGATEYTTAIDVWSAGCVMAELLLGQPLFPGESGVDQLVEIIKVLGTPTREEIKCMNPNYTEFKFPQIKAHPWHKIFHKRMPPEAVDLVSRLLQYSPSLRCGALDALVHPFFDELRDPNARLPNGRFFPPLFNFKPHELKGVPVEMVAKLVPEHARKQCPWLGL